MSRRKNGTNRAAARLGLNPYGWGNGGKRKSPRGMEVPAGAMDITINDRISEIGGKING